MKGIFLCVLVILATLKMHAQNYRWGASEKYKKEDSMFVIWEKDLTRKFPDSPKPYICWLILDSVVKIKKERNIQGHISFKNHDDVAYYESLIKEKEPVINQMLDSNKRDSSESKKGKMLMISLPPRRDNIN